MAEDRADLGQKNVSGSPVASLPTSAPTSPPSSVLTPPPSSLPSPLPPVPHPGSSAPPTPEVHGHGTLSNRVGFWLYLVTDGLYDSRTGQAVFAPLEGRLVTALSAVPRGSVAVQLRARGLEGAALLSAAERLRQLTKRFGAPFFVNDRLDVALLVGADGVHLPQTSLPAKAARRLGGPRLLIGVSTHSLAEARTAVDGSADFVTYGPVWPTPSKPALDVTAFPPPASPSGALVFPVGVEGLADAVTTLPVPVFALGGVDSPDRARQCISAGARVACLRAVLGVDDPAAAALALLDAMGAGAHHGQCDS